MPSYYSITTEGAEAGSTAGVETLLMLKGVTTVKGRICEWGVGFDGTSATAVPIEVSVKRGNSTSDGAFTAATEESWDPDNPTANCVGGHSFTSDPTYAGQPLQSIYVHPQGGNFVWQALPGRELTLDNTTASFIGLVVNTTAAVNARAYLVWEE